jgi:MFS family permease
MIPLVSRCDTADFRFLLLRSQHKRLVLNFINSITSMMGALSGALVVDRLGRRKLLLTGTSALVVCLAIVVGLLHGASGNTKADPHWSAARGNAGITFSPSSC